MNTFIKALAFALIAAVGNAIFVYGQKKSVPSSNPFIFLLFALSICVLMLLIAFSFFPQPNLKEYLQTNYKAILITAIGLFITYIGFYLLYSRFGASQYILYAVTSIITTSIIVGVIFFNEKFNLFYLLSVMTAIGTIILFFLGQKK